MNHRSFDLGGNGLKTCRFHDSERAPEDLLNLGVSEHDDIHRWIRETLPTLEQEISEQFAFSFSLAGLDKLSKSRQLPNRRDSQSIAGLFGLPEERVFTANDGDAHLVASRTWLNITQFPHINFSVGTGVGIGMYDDNGHQVLEHRLASRLGRNVWDFVTHSSASKKKVRFALASRGYKELERQDPSNALSRFERRWLNFLQNQFFSALGSVPKTITFTGGIVEYANLFSAPQTVMKCQIQRGPNHAGLRGAALHAGTCPETGRTNR